MATRPTTPRKPAARKAVVSKAAPTATKAVAAKPLTPRATKAPVRRAVTTARKPVSTIVASNLKPVVAKSVVAATKKTATVPSKKAVTPKKVKLVRDNFSLPAHEHALLKDLKKRAKKLGKEFNKSEFLRAGIAHLVALTDTVLLNTLSKVERVKAGRPSKKGKKK